MRLNTERVVRCCLWDVHYSNGNLVAHDFLGIGIGKVSIKKLL